MSTLLFSYCLFDDAQSLVVRPAEPTVTTAAACVFVDCIVVCCWSQSRRLSVLVWHVVENGDTLCFSRWLCEAQSTVRCHSEPVALRTVAVRSVCTSVFVWRRCPALAGPSCSSARVELMCVFSKETNRSVCGWRIFSISCTQCAHAQD